MESSPDLPPTAATDEPTVPATHEMSVPAVHMAGQLTESLIASVLDAGQDARPDRAQREDGWTPERIATFLNTLAETACVSDAARAAGMSLQGAYKFRDSAKGRPFRLAWRAAHLLGRRRLEDDMMSRAVNGSVEIIRRDGQVWGERHRFDSRLGMAMLTRLDNIAAADDELNAPARVVAEEFEQFVEIVSKGGKGASDFVRDRVKIARRNREESEQLERAENYQLYGVGLPEEIDVSDLNVDDMASWTDEQAERARRARLLDPPAAPDESDDDSGLPAGFEHPVVIFQDPVRPAEEWNDD